LGIANLVCVEHGIISIAAKVVTAVHIFIKGTMKLTAAPFKKYQLDQFLITFYSLSSQDCVYKKLLGSLVLTVLKACATTTFKVKESWLPKDEGSIFLQNVDKLSTRLHSFQCQIT
jgi:hypothetical protein